MKKIEENGRSMVEMLGVLAIVGVLSVGGIAGYTSAMRSYRANEIVNATSMLFMLGLAQNAGEGTGTLEYSSVAGQLPSGCGGITYKGDKATLDVNIEDETICKQVKTKLGDKAGDCTAATTPATGYNLTVTLGESSGVGTVPIIYDFLKDDPDYNSCLEDGGTDAYCGCMIDFDDDHETCSDFSSCIASGRSFNYCECIYMEHNEDDPDACSGI